MRLAPRSSLRSCVALGGPGADSRPSCADPAGSARVRRRPLPAAAVLRSVLAVALVTTVSALAAAQTAPVAPRPATFGAPAPDVVGTWDLESAENVPLDDRLVFARLAFTDREVRTLTVALADDGDLDGERTRARYLVSDGQLVVRRANGVTVWAVGREDDRLVVHDIETGVVLRLRLAAPDVGVDPGLIGAWAGTREGRPFAVRFRPDGTAEVQVGDDRDEGEWTVAGAYLLLDEDPARYGLGRDADGVRQLVVEASGERTVLRQIAE